MGAVGAGAETRRVRDPRRPQASGRSIPLRPDTTAVGDSMAVDFQRGPPDHRVAHERNPTTTTGHRVASDPDEHGRLLGVLAGREIPALRIEAGSRASRTGGVSP